MKAITLQEKIERELTTKSGDIKARYQYVIGDLLNGRTFRMRWTNRGRTLVTTSYDAAIEVFTLLGIDYEQGNDAPRGGMEGYYVRISDKGRRQTADFLKEFKGNKRYFIY